MDYGLHKGRSRRNRIGKTSDFAAIMPKAGVKSAADASETADPLKARQRRRKLAKDLTR